MFDIDKSHLQLTICPGHLESFGITWRSNKRYCTAPISVKGERGIARSAKFDTREGTPAILRHGVSTEFNWL